MNTLINQTEYQDYTIELHWDECSSDFNPRTAYSNLGNIVIFDQPDYTDPGVMNWTKETFFEEVLKEENLFYIPIEFWAESGRASVRPTDEDHCTGVIFVSLESIMKEYSFVSIDAARMYCDTFDDHVYEEGSKKVKHVSVRKVLEQELETWKEWLNGEVYWFTIYGPGEDEPLGEIGSTCSGYIGDDGQYAAIEDAKQYIDYYIEDQLEKEAEANRYMAL